MNFKHLQYFWTVAKAGGVMRASEQLHVTPQAISGQLRLLEESLGASLLQKQGRGLELTDMGRLVLSYADEIFSLGEELKEAVSVGPAGVPREFRVGIGDMVPKTVAFHLLQPALQLSPPQRLICREGQLLELLGELAMHRLDLVIADRPLTAEANIKGFNHLLGESGLTVMGVPALCKQYAGEFPACLNGAPFLLPGPDAAIRPRLLAWLAQRQIKLKVVGEFDDGALLKAFGKAGAGFFIAPTVLQEEVAADYAVSAIGELSGLGEQFYAISVERQIRHPAVLAVNEQARHALFVA
ncbi:transcriptional activator NhaR [Chitinimonas sp.]|uniref:transcriptional activator NhaR n=1 Tax=Chitinimonas sp. TaxID=1934313 RepID=UPI0035B0BFE7